MHGGGLAPGLMHGGGLVPQPRGKCELPSSHHLITVQRTAFFWSVCVCMLAHMHVHAHTLLLSSV